ncbi:FeS assembly SUF system protein [Rhodothermaceae bacterium RA]|nr:FeS assembly SUF system protein [Rhodothermaceae bacterium RA]
MHTVIENHTGDQDLEARVIEAIREVYDPEIPVNVFDLGLIYVIEIREDRTVFIKMTLTTPNCPVAGVLPGQVETAVGHTEGVEDVIVQLTFDPPFSPDLMSDEAKVALGFM